MMLNLNLSEDDYEAALGKAVTADFRLRRDAATLSDEQVQSREQRVRDALPKVIFHRIRGLIPDDLEVSELSIAIGFKGSPFNVGIESSATVKLTPRRPSGTPT